MSILESNQALFEEQNGCVSSYPEPMSSSTPKPCVEKDVEFTDFSNSNSDDRDLNDRVEDDVDLHKEALL